MRRAHRSLTLAVLKTAARAVVFVLAFFLFGCERGCARSWFEEHGVARDGRREAPGSPALNAVDCPDGLARCNDGVVEVSRLAMIAQPCHGSPEQCRCPWERVQECDRGCAAEGLTIVAEREKGRAQLCAPEADAGVSARALAVTSPGQCEEDELYRCSAGAVVSCAESAVVGMCVRGCFTEGASIDREIAVSREAAFAILCSR
ncbi:MAG TPA: hypothetical protein VGL81_15585 [Polyangiaceae bacterium]|jgi:hypothetical protein